MAWMPAPTTRLPPQARPGSPRRSSRASWRPRRRSTTTSPAPSVRSPTSRWIAAPCCPSVLQTHYGVPGSLDLLHALWVHSQQRTAVRTERYVNRPDFIDVLRSLQKDRGEPFGDLLLEYAIARAFVGDRDDGIHMPDSTWLGRAGRVRFNTSFSYSKLPQWIRPVRPIEPTGATYLWLDLRDAPQGSRARISCAVGNPLGVSVRLCAHRRRRHRGRAHGSDVARQSLQLNVLYSPI